MACDCDHDCRRADHLLGGLVYHSVRLLRRLLLLFMLQLPEVLRQLLRML
jgi:hypothetical protein